MGSIVLLDDLTINQIAAGEVIERPASVVKEMVENSIDAGATRISVEIKNGGISFIKVTDNGKGIEKDDLEMAFERHATSKIKNAEDISKITSMGFRGEALASIAAIANVEMISRKKDRRIGNRIVVEGGNVLEKSEIGASFGTTITVKNLFYNTPVRYKFLKKDYTESGYIEDVITRAALVNTNISFKLINSGKTVIQTSGNGSLKDVVYSIYGKEIANNLLDVDYEFEGIKVKGVIGKSEIARSNRSQQLFFVNGRHVKDKTLTAAADNSFKEFIPANKYGFIVLNVEIDPARIDVNVHPAKLEIRFEDEGTVFKAVYHAIKDRLSKVVEEKIAKEKSVDPISKHIRHHHFEELDQVKEPESLEEKSELVFDAIRDDSDAYRERRSNNFFKKKKQENEFGSNENLMEEVYKFRKGLKEIGVSEVSAYTPIEIPTSEEEERARDEKLASVKEEVERTQAVETVKDNAEEVREEIKEEVKEEEEKSLFDDVLQAAEEEALRVKMQEENEDEEVEETSEEVTENRGKHSTVSTPTEEDVEKRTLEIIKNRDHNDLTNKLEQEPKKQSFDDMYSKIFGNKVNQETVVVNAGKLTEKEKSLFDEIRNSVIKKDEDGQEEKPLEEEKLEEELEDQEEEKTPTEELAKKQDVEDAIEDLKETEEADDDVMVQDDSYVEANLDEITFSGNVSDDDEESDEKEEKAEEVEEVPESKELILETDEPEEAEAAEEEKPQIIEEEPLEEVIEEEPEKNQEWKNESLVPDEEGLESEEIEETSKDKYRVVGEAFNQYAVLEFDKEIAIVDINEANEKLLEGRITSAFYSEDKDNQTMLMADVIPLTNKETNLIKTYLNLFEKAGFELEAFGENTIKLSTVPNICIDMNTKHLFLELLDDTENYDRLTEEEQEKSFIENLAKKVAHTIDFDEDDDGVQKVMKALFETEKPLEYDDGRKIAMKLSKYEIERKFSRK